LGDLAGRKKSESHSLFLWQHWPSQTMVGVPQMLVNAQTPTRMLQKQWNVVSENIYSIRAVVECRTELNAC
jgi:hypothetical protein